MAAFAIVLILVAVIGLQSKNLICLLLGLVALIFVCFAFGAVGTIAFLLVALLAWFISNS